MANVLEIKSLDDLHTALIAYNSDMADIPQTFTVLEEYRFGLSEEEFSSLFREFSALVVRMYDGIIDSPEKIGLVSVDKHGNLKLQKSQNVSSLKKLFYTIGLVSALDGDILRASSADFMNAYLTFYPNSSVALADSIKAYSPEQLEKSFRAKHLDLLFDHMREFGFEVSLDDVLTLSYPKAPALVRVIKAFSMPRICRVSFGFDYTKCNYRVFSHPSDKTIPLCDLCSFQMLTSEQQEFLTALNSAMNAANATYGECESGWYHGTQPCQYIYRSKVRVMQNKESGLIPFVVMKLDKKAAKVEKFIENLPDRYLDCVVRCSGCKKGPCNHRVKVNIRGKANILCGCAWWWFPPEKDSIPVILAAYKL